MNKKLLFGIVSLAALAACSTDDFESQKVAQETSSVQFEVINSDDVTRASMNGNSIVWNANQNDLFTLYHGSATSPWTSGYENATYKANANPGGTATLTTPTVIKEGKAIMVWPVDTTFRIKAADALTLTIPATLKNVENSIPYVSDLLDINAYAPYSEAGFYATAYNTAGKDRKYPIFMRPMASQLTIKADYVNTDKTIAQLYEGGSDGLTGEDAIDPINVTSVDLLTQTSGGTEFTTEIPLLFTAPTAAIQTQWNGVDHNKKSATATVWNQVTGFDVANIATNGEQVNKLTTEVITGTESSKFLILPQATMSTTGQGVLQGGVVVNTRYGRVVIADPANTYDNTNYGYAPVATGAQSKYTAGEYAKAWYRSRAARPATEEDGETTTAAKVEFPDGTQNFKSTANVEMGLKQTINAFSAATASSGVVKGEPVGASSTRWVEVRLNHLDMSDLHIKNDKQLRDVVRVWKKLGLTPVTVLLDGNFNKEFEISQKTIEVINQLNTRTGANLNFRAMPCQISGEVCNTIVIKGADYKQEIQNIDFIVDNGGVKADVALKNEGTANPWKWNSSNTVKVLETGVNSIINRGTFESTTTATLQTRKNTSASATTQNNVLFINNGTWNIKNNATVNVQFDVTNNGTLNIPAGAQYRQDGRLNGSNTLSTFTNEAKAKPSRFGGNDNQIGKVNNSGVFATVASGEINNYGLIEHAHVDAKTYVTTNQTSGADFTNAFSAVSGSENKMGRINLPWGNRAEDNVSISAALSEGFVSVTVDGEVTSALNATQLGDKVNYLIIKSGPTEISNVASQVDYLEVNADKEIAWSVLATTQNFVGLMVLSDINIKLNTTVNATVTYLGKDMYVGGTFNNPGTNWNGYYGNTATKVATNYITY